MNSFNATISYDSEFEKMSGVTALKFFIEFAFGFKRFIFRIGILFCPDFRFFGMVGNNGNPKSGDVEKAFKKFFAFDFGKFGIRILRKDTPNVLKREHFIAGSIESNDAVVNIAVERRKFSSGDYIITIHDFFVVKFNDATEIFGFKNGNDANVVADINFVIPDYIAYFIFRRELGIRKYIWVIIEKDFFFWVNEFYNSFG